MKEATELTGRYIMTLFYWDVMSELEIVDCFENGEALTDGGYTHIL